MENKLFIHFREDETKSILFSKTRSLREINIFFEIHRIKQHETVEYLGCYLDSELRREAMVSKVRKNINVKQKFLYRQSRYLTSTSKRQCNVLIHSEISD